MHRIDPRATAPVTNAATVWAEGLSTINGCAFNPDGKYFHASEFLFVSWRHTYPQPGHR